MWQTLAYLVQYLRIY